MTNQPTRNVSGWAAQDSSGFITPYTFQRRGTGENDVVIEILYCGICHSDLHVAKNDWNTTMYPVVPGHEITGLVKEVGSKVRNFKEGDRVGVGCIAATCLDCHLCQTSQENYCDKLQQTYNGIFWDGNITYGGYSNIFVSDHRYVVHIPKNLPMDAAAPLLCAGVTVFTPLKDSGMLSSPGKKLGIVGLGGLGHLAVKFGKAFGLNVTVISTSPAKEREARERLGIDDFVVSSDYKEMKVRNKTMDFILDTVSAQHNLGAYLELLKVDGTLSLVGAPDKPLEFNVFPLIMGKRSIKGSVIGSIKETQEMMDLCGEYAIKCDIEVIKPDYINKAFERLARNDVRYRFVIDIAGITAPKL